MRKTPSSVLCQAWDSFEEAVQQSQDRPSEKTVHQLRISTRRLEATLTVVQGLGVAHKAKKILNKLQDIRDTVGDLRDTQVSKTLWNEGHPTEAKGFQVKLKRKRKKLKRKVGTYLGGLSLDREHTYVKNIISLLKDRETKMAPAELRQCIDNASRPSEMKFEGLRRQLSVSRLKEIHQFRLLAKRLRYQGEVQKALLGATRLDVNKLELVQDIVGQSCDEWQLRRRFRKYLKTTKSNHRAESQAIQDKLTEDVGRSLRRALKKIAQIAWTGNPAIHPKL